MISEISRRCLIVFAAFLAAPVATFACSICVKDSISEEEFDRSAWNVSENVFVVLVTESRLGPVLESSSAREVAYSFVLEEVIRGEYRPSLRVSSMRGVGPWNREYVEIGCGPDLVISPGDRILVFDDGSSKVKIDRCSYSRPVEPYSTIGDNESIRTIDRLRRWAKEVVRPAGSGRKQPVE